MRIYVAKTMAWVILGLVVTVGLLGVVVGSGWMALGDNGGGDFGPSYSTYNSFYSGKDYTYNSSYSGSVSMLKIGFFLIAVGCGLLCYVTWDLTFYGIVILDDILQYVDGQIAYRSPWLHEKAYSLISILPLL